MGFEYARMITKSGNGVPTIPVSPTHDNGDWLATDIYENELYMDNSTGKVYTRIRNAIVPIAPTADAVKRGFRMIPAHFSTTSLDFVNIEQFTIPIAAGKVTEIQIVGAYISGSSSNGVKFSASVRPTNGTIVGSIYMGAGMKADNAQEIGNAFAIVSPNVADTDLVCNNADGGVSDFINLKAVFDASNSKTDGVFTFAIASSSAKIPVQINAGSTITYTNFLPNV